MQTRKKALDILTKHQCKKVTGGEQETVTGIINGKVKGGFTVEEDNKKP